MEIAFEELILTGRLKFGCRFCFLARENKTKTEKGNGKHRITMETPSRMFIIYYVPINSI